MSTLFPHLTEQNIGGKVFSFHNDDGPSINLTFHPDHRVTGGHPNESFWAIQNGFLVLKDQNQNVSAHFSNMKAIDGKLYASGLFVLPGFGVKAGWKHHLNESRPHVTRENIVGKAFIFRNEEGPGIRHVLGHDGHIQGSTHPNESSFDFVNGHLEYRDASGKPTCRFTEYHVVDGKLILSGLYLGEGAPAGWRHFLKEEGPNSSPNIQHNQVAGKRFVYFNESGSPVDLTLRADGVIEGSRHPNETRWSTENGRITFYNANGSVSCHFNDIFIIGGHIHANGLYIGKEPNPPCAGWRHYLNEKSAY